MQSDSEVDELREEIGAEDVDATYSRGDKENQLFRLLEKIKQRVRSENDLTMATTGPEGSGKSTLAIKLGMYLDDEYKTNPDKWIDENIVVNPDVEQMQNKILHGPPFSYYCIDEAIRIMYKRESFSFENRFLVKLFSVARKCKKIVNVCIPNFQDLDSFARQHRVKLWMYVPCRGRCVVSKPIPCPFSTDVWLRDENERIYMKALGKRSITEYSVDEQIEALKQTKNYLFDFYFDKLPTSVEERYLKNVETLRKEMDYAKEKEKEVKEKHNKYKFLFYKTRGYFTEVVRLAGDEGITQSVVANFLGVPPEEIKTMIQSHREYLDKLKRREKIDEEKEM